ncbi:MAG: hypothetical protein ACQERU_07870 [Bacteroidota bacterium]
MSKSRLKPASISFTIILILWPLLAFISLPAGNTFTDQLLSIKNSPGLYTLNFIIAFLIAPAIIFMLYEFYKKSTGKPWNFTAKTGFILYILYFVIVNISYGSQFLYLPFIIDSLPEKKILEWYFFNADSLVILINQTGYLIWSIATLFIFMQPIFKGTLAFFITKILILSALTQMVATIGLYFDQSNLSGLTFYSGILLLPAGVLIIIYSYINKSPGNHRHAYYEKK